MHSQLALTEHVSLNLAPLILLGPVLMFDRHAETNGPVSIFRHSIQPIFSQMPTSHMTMPDPQIARHSEQRSSLAPLSLPRLHVENVDIIETGKIYAFAPRP